jgi:hypothetical protein
MLDVPTGVTARFWRMPRRGEQSVLFRGKLAAAGWAKMAMSYRARGAHALSHNGIGSNSRSRGCFTKDRRRHGALRSRAG